VLRTQKIGRVVLMTVVGGKGQSAFAADRTDWSAWQEPVLLLQGGPKLATKTPYFARSFKRSDKI